MTSENRGPYSACHTSKDDPPFVYGIEGPGQGIGYYAWYSNPQNTFENFADAEKAARLMNLAFAQGLAERSRQFRELLK